MVRARHVKLGPFKRWWASRSDSHFQIVTSVSILSVAATLWGFVFLFILGGATDPSKQNLVPFSWGCLFFGGLFAFYILPDFFAYLRAGTQPQNILNPGVPFEVAEEFVKEVESEKITAE